MSDVGQGVSCPSALLDDEGLRLLVGAFYRALLGREPDAEGFAHNLARLRELGGLDGAERMLTDFLNGGEFARRQQERFGRTPDAVRTPGGTDGSVEIGQVVSLGTHCFTSALLKRNGLKRFSGPFDWIFSSPAMVRHCLEDDFRTFLDRRHYEPVPVEQRQQPLHGRCGHGFYRDRFGIRNLFNHHDAATDEHHGYFVRCVERFRRCSEGEGRSLLVQCRWEQRDTVGEFEATARTVDRVTRGGVLNVFAISRSTAGGLLPELLVLRELGHHRLYRLVPVSPWRPLRFEDPIDDLAIIRALRRYDLRLPPAQRTPPAASGPGQQQPAPPPS